MAAVSSLLRALDDAAKASKSLRLTAQFSLPAGETLTAIVTSNQYNGILDIWLKLELRSGDDSVTNFTQAKTLAAAFREIAKKHPKATPQPASVKVSVTKTAVKSAELKTAVVQALHEVYGLPVPSLDEVTAAQKAGRAAKRAAGDDTISLLRSGRAGIRAFNDRSLAQRSATVLRKAGLSGCDLTKAQFGAADLEGADLSRAVLAHASFGDGESGCSLKGAKLGGADLSSANLFLSKCREADFTKAKLDKANLRNAAFAHARFLEADLTGANLTFSDLKEADLTGATLIGCRLDHADLRGADFSKADLTDCMFREAVFDEKTRWPKGFKPAAEMCWKGKGADPRLAPTQKELAKPKPTDVAGFLDRLKTAADEAKLDRAMAMLKADRFRLFARVRDDHLVGVVKSQSDPALVYSCRLGADGSYSCCTQNLNVCGGLRGSPCKHLLVLIVGLTQAGELDPGAAHDWTQATRGRKPELDRDLMTETFLQYKGAEAGEVDWRPTETIPEDFYAM